MKYDPSIVTIAFLEAGLPLPEYEWRFHPTRKWRWDIAWPRHQVALEVMGGIFIAGGHNRGGQMVKDMEKWNAGTICGWKLLWCQPKEVCMDTTIGLLKAALGL